MSLHPGSCINSVLGESLGAGGGGKDGKPRAAAVAGKRGASVAVGGVAGRGGTSLAKELLVFSTVSQSVSQWVRALSASVGNVVTLTRVPAVAGDGSPLFDRCPARALTANRAHAGTPHRCFARLLAPACGPLAAV